MNFGDQCMNDYPVAESPHQTYENVNGMVPLMTNISWFHFDESQVNKLADAKDMLIK